MKFEKPTILIEIGGCKVKGYMTGQKLDKLIMLAAVTDFARQELTAVSYTHLMFLYLKAFLMYA